MATYYWTGGSGAWEDGSKWSLTSGVPPSNPVTVTSITNVIVGAGGGTAVTTPSSGTNDTGFFTLTLPFSISFLGTSYSTIYVGTNGYITFTGGGAGFANSFGFSSFTLASPCLNICASGDISCQRIYHETLGTVGSRTYRVRYEGTNGSTGTLGSPNKIYEIIFYEATPAQIDIHYGPSMTGAIGASPGVFSATQFIRGLPSTTSTNVSYSITTSAGTVNVPGIADDVIFDSASHTSSYTVTITGDTVSKCLNWTVSGPASGTVTFSGGGTLRIHGGVTWGSAGVARSYVGVMYFDASSGTHTINFGGILQGSTLYFGDAQQSTATWNLGAGLSISGASTYILLRSGTFSTQGFSLSTSGRIDSNISTYTRTLDFNNSTVTLTAAGNLLFELNATNLTFNTTSSIINLAVGGSGAQVRLTGGLNYGYVKVAATQDTNSATDRIGYRTGTGAVNISTLDLVISSRLRSYALVFGNATYNIGTLLCSTPSSSPKNRIVISGTNLTPSAPGPTLNVTTISDTTEKYDFRGIAATGSATWSGDWGDWGGNTGITFPAAKTVYLINDGTYGLFYDGSYSNTSGGATSDTHFPLAQDTVIIDNNSNSPVLVNAYTSGSPGCLTTLDFSNRTTPLSFDWRFGLYLKGSLIGSSAVTVLNSSNLTMIGSENAIINLNGMPPPSIIIAKNSGVSVDLQSSVVSSNSILLNGGILNTNNYTIICAFLTFSGTVNPIAFNSGTSVVYVTSTLTFQYVSFNHTFSVDNTKFIMFGTGTTTLSYNYPNAASPQNARFYYQGASGGSLLLTSAGTGSYTMKYFESTKTNAVIQIQTSRTFTFTESFKIRSNIGDRAQLKAASTTPVSINYTGTGVIDLDYIDVSYVNCTTANKFFAGKNSVSVVGTNTNWTFGNYSKRPQKGNALSFLS